DIAHARLHLEEYIAGEPEMTVRRFAEERSSVPLDEVSPIYRRETERILEGLRRAGMKDDSGDRSSLESDTVSAGVRGGATEPQQPVTELIGRETELSEVADLVRTHRLVTLIGEGGVGKTRLGIEVARHLSPNFADGARVAELAPLSDSGLVPVSVATALGLKFAAGAICAELVARALGTNRLILVLDNCEHVIDAAAMVAEALWRARPTIRVLATSREPLRAEGEYLHRVPPLAVPAEGVEDVEEMLQAGAVQLFVARARAANPHFSPDRRTAAI